MSFHAFENATGKNVGVKICYRLTSFHAFEYAEMQKWKYPMRSVFSHIWRRQRKFKFVHRLFEKQRRGRQNLAIKVGETFWKNGIVYNSYPHNLTNINLCWPHIHLQRAISGPRATRFIYLVLSSAPQWWAPSFSPWTALSDGRDDIQGNCWCNSWAVITTLSFYGNQIGCHSSSLRNFKQKCHFIDINYVDKEPLSVASWLEWIS